jgi:hypothetical protein
VPKEGARSALVRRASGQLKPSPNGRQEGLDLSLWEECLCVLAVNGVTLLVEDVPLVDDSGRCFVTNDAPKEGYLPLPLPLPTRSRNACAPKETRLANGVVGDVIGVSFSFSSNTACSNVGEVDITELETLPRCTLWLPNGDV